MRPKWTAVAKYQSRSNPDTIYEVKRDGKGNLSCTCPAWIYKAKGTRTCKHVEDFARTFEGFTEVTDIPTYEESLRMQQDPEYEARWLESHIKPRRL